MTCWNRELFRPSIHDLNLWSSSAFANPHLNCSPSTPKDGEQVVALWHAFSDQLVTNRLGDWCCLETTKKAHRICLFESSCTTSWCCRRQMANSHKAMHTRERPCSTSQLRHLDNSCHRWAQVQHTQVIHNTFATGCPCRLWAWHTVRNRLVSSIDCRREANSPALSLDVHSLSNEYMPMLRWFDEKRIGLPIRSGDLWLRCNRTAHHPDNTWMSNWN